MCIGVMCICLHVYFDIYQITVAASASISNNIYEARTQLTIQSPSHYNLKIYCDTSFILGVAHLITQIALFMKRCMTCNQVMVMHLCVYKPGALGIQYFQINAKLT